MRRKNCRAHSNNQSSSGKKSSKKWRETPVFGQVLGFLSLNFVGTFFEPTCMKDATKSPRQQPRQQPLLKNQQHSSRQHSSPPPKKWLPPKKSRQLKLQPQKLFIQPKNTELKKRPPPPPKFPPPKSQRQSHQPPQNNRKPRLILQLSQPLRKSPHQPKLSEKQLKWKQLKLQSQESSPTGRQFGMNLRTSVIETRLAVSASICANSMR